MHGSEMYDLWSYQKCLDPMGSTRISREAFPRLLHAIKHYESRSPQLDKREARY